MKACDDKVKEATDKCLTNIVSIDQQQNAGSMSKEEHDKEEAAEKENYKVVMAAIEKVRQWNKDMHQPKPETPKPGGNK